MVGQYILVYDSCLKLEGCVSEAMVDGLERFLGMAVWLSRSGDTALLQLKHKEAATILTCTMKADLVLLCTQPKGVMTKI